MIVLIMKRQSREAARLVVLLTLTLSLLCLLEVGMEGNVVHGNSLTQVSSGGVPRSAVYDVKITGRTFSGNTNFPTERTNYSPVQDFTLRGLLVVLPTRDATGVNFDNGINPR